MKCKRYNSICLIGLCVSANAFGQSVQLALSSGAVGNGLAGVLELSNLSIGTKPSALQWTFSYPPNSLTGLSVTAGSAASGAGKSIYCNSLSAGITTCLLAGMNATAIANGVVASVNFTALGSAAIQVLNVAAASSTGDGLLGGGIGGALTVLTSGITDPSLTALTCSPSTVTAGLATQCTVAASGPAGLLGLPVSLGYVTSNALVAMPSSILIPAGAASAGFKAEFDTTAPPATAVLTATANKITQKATVTIVSAPTAPAPSSPDLVPIKLFNTGVSDLGTLAADGLADSHYTLLASADSIFRGPGAFVVNSAVFPIGPWLANGPNSKWIAPSSKQTDGNQAGDYVYRTTFDLTGLNPAAAVISGKVLADNAVVVKLNGTPILSSSGFAEFVPFAAASGFVSGVNTLDFVVSNWIWIPGAVNPTGLRAEVSGTAVRLKDF